MNIRQETFPLPHPLSCLEQAKTYKDALDGKGWTEKTARIIFRLVNMTLVVLMSAAAFGLLWLGPDSGRFVQIFMAVCAFGSFVGAYFLLVDAVRLREFLRMPNRRLPDEEAIACDTFMRLNFDLATIYREQIVKATEAYNRENSPRTVAELDRILDLIDRLVVLDGKFYVIAQQHKELDFRSAAAESLNLDRAVECFRDMLPPVHTGSA